jgi:hypothetical protein
MIAARDARPTAERSVICSVSGVAGMAPAAPVTVVLEPHGRLGPQPIQWAREGETRRHHRPISAPNALPTHPAGRYH